MAGEADGSHVTCGRVLVVPLLATANCIFFCRSFPCLLLNFFSCSHSCLSCRGVVSTGEKPGAVRGRWLACEAALCLSPWWCIMHQGHFFLIISSYPRFITFCISSFFLPPPCRASHPTASDCAGMAPMFARECSEHVRRHHPRHTLALLPSPQARSGGQCLYNQRFRIVI